MFEDKSVLRLNISGLIKSLLIVTGVLLLLSVGSSLYYYTFHDLAYINSLFSFDKESNIPTRYASGLLVMASLLFFIIYIVKKKGNEKFQLNWFFLSIIFLMMGLDESVSLHEQTSQIVKNYVKGLHFAWVIPGILFVIIFAAAYLKFYFSLESKWKKLFFLSAFIYLTGALGMELVTNFFQASAGQDNLGYVLLTNLEEIFEFSGVTLLIYTLLSYLKNMSPCYRVDLVDKDFVKTKRITSI